MTLISQSGSKEALNFLTLDYHNKLWLLSAYYLLSTWSLSGLKVTGDSLHLEIFASTKPFVFWQRSIYEAEANITGVVIKTAAVTLKQLHCHESQTMTATVTILCVKFCPDKGFWPTIYRLVTDYLAYSSARIGSPLHRAFTEGKLHKRRLFMPSIMADQMVNTAV